MSDDIPVSRGPRPWRAVRSQLRLPRWASETDPIWDADDPWREVRGFYPDAEIWWDHTGGAVLGWSRFYLKLQEVSGNQHQTLGWHADDWWFRPIEHPWRNERVRVGRKHFATDTERYQLAQTQLVAFRCDDNGQLVRSRKDSFWNGELEKLLFDPEFEKWIDHSDSTQRRSQKAESSL